MKNIFSIIAIGLIVSFSSCDKVEGPYGTGSSGNGGGDTTQQIIRKVLVEDFTGHRCGNCPRAAESLKQLENLYGDQIVSIAVHAGFFAEPAGSIFGIDYRTPIGDELDDLFGNSAAGLPNGLINRKSYNGETIIQHTNWASKTSEWINLPPDAHIIINPDYNTGNRELSVEVRTQFLNQIDESLNMVYYIVEDSIQSPQADYDLPAPSYITDYYHRHMLRGSLNGAFGEPLSSSNTYAVNQEITTTSSGNIPAEWDDSKVYLVAVLYRTLSYEVVQVEEIKIR